MKSTQQKHTRRKQANRRLQACLRLALKTLKKRDRLSIILIIDPYEYDLHRLSTFFLFFKTSLNASI